jgi:hypothetical protein
MKLRMWVDALGAGATTGVVAEVLVLRMNPEVTQTIQGVLVGVPLWASWGMLMVGVPLICGVAVFDRIRPSADRWLAPILSTVIFVVAAVLTAVNARLHALLLSGPAHRVLVQDAVAWALAAVLAATIGLAVRRFGNRRRWQVLFSILMVALPVIRVVTSPTPTREYLEVAPRPIGIPERRLLVIGLEGFDSKVLLADAASASYTAVARLRESGARASLRPHRPFLRWALWTSAATGTYPGRHGVKAHRGWDLPPVFSETLRLLPWTPEGSRMILPWGLSKQVPPPPATVAPLWSLLDASGVSTRVLGWPGSWGDDRSLIDPQDAEFGATLEPAIRTSLEAALEELPDNRSRIWAAILQDQSRVQAAVNFLESDVANVWIHLEALSLARRYHEPLRPGHTRKRLFLELMMELVDDQLGELLAATDQHTLIAVVSPFGLVPPGSFERLKRTFGGGGDWHTSAESSPDGLFILLGNGVDPGRRVAVASPPDVAPTLCYLLGLPVAQYMEGSIATGAISQSFLAEHPLRVVD